MDEKRYVSPDFGGWLRGVLDSSGTTIQALALETRLHHAQISRLLNSSKTDKPIRPDKETVATISEGLVHMGIVTDPDAAFVAAGYLPEGYGVVKIGESGVYSAEPPENFSEWPSELQEALSYTRDMDAETQRYIYGLWRLQASAHYDIAKRTQEARRQLEEREARLRELDGREGAE